MSFHSSHSAMLEEKEDKDVSDSRRSIESEDDDVAPIDGEEQDEDAIHTLEPGEKSSHRTASVRSKRSTLSRVASRLTTHSIVDPGPAPDGGLKAWLQIAGGWLATLTTWGWVNCFGVFQTYYTLHLSESPSTISWIGTLQTFLTFVIGPFSGRLLDAGYFYPVVITGTVLQILGIFLMSISKTYWQLLLTQGVITGIGGGILFCPCMGIMATYFSKKRAWAMGIASTGNSAGGLVYPVVVQQLLPQLGFGWTTRILGFINLAFLITVIIIMRPRLPPRKAGPIIDWPAFKEMPYVLFLAGMFFQFWCLYFTLYFVASFGLQEAKLSLRDSINLLIIINGIGFPARFLPAFMGDKVGQLNLIAPMAAVLSVIAWSWLAVSSRTGVYVFACFFGFVTAGCQCLIPPAVAALTDDMTKIGSRLGMNFAFMGLGALTGSPIGGAIIQSENGKYTGAIAWSAASCSIYAGIMILTRMTRAKWKLKARV